MGFNSFLIWPLIFFLFSRANLFDTSDPHTFPTQYHRGFTLYLLYHPNTVINDNTKRRPPIYLVKKNGKIKEKLKKVNQKYC